MLKPEISVMAALATGAMVVGIYQTGLPPTADIRRADPGDGDIASARRQKLWTAAALTGAVSLVARDPAIAIVGWGTAVALDWHARHASWVNPVTGTVDRILSREEQAHPTQAQDPTAYGPAGSGEVMYDVAA